LCAVFLIGACGSAAEGGEKNPTPALLDAVKASLADLKPITVQIDHDKIALEIGLGVPADGWPRRSSSGVRRARPPGLEAKSGRF